MVIEQFQYRAPSLLGEKLLCFLKSGKHSAGIIKLRCKDATKIDVHKSVLQASSEHFEELFNKNGIESDEVFDVDFSGPVMDTVLEYIYIGQVDFKVDQVVQVFSAACKFGLRDLAKDTKEFVINNPSRCLESSNFLQFDAAEDVVLLKEIFSDIRFTGRLLLYMRICDWKRRMFSKGIGDSLELLDRDFFETLIDKNLLLCLERLQIGSKFDSSKIPESEF